MTQGWTNESERHKLSSMGIKNAEAKQYISEHKKEFKDITDFLLTPGMAGKDTWDKINFEWEYHKEHFVSSHQLMKNAHGGNLCDNVDECASKYKNEMKDQGYFVRSKTVGFSDLGRNYYITVVAVKKKIHIKPGKFGCIACDKQECKVHQ